LAFGRRLCARLGAAGQAKCRPDAGGAAVSAHDQSERGFFRIPGGGFAKEHDHFDMAFDVTTADVLHGVFWFGMGPEGIDQDCYFAFAMGAWADTAQCGPDEVHRYPHVRSDGEALLAADANGVRAGAWSACVVSKSTATAVAVAVMKSTSAAVRREVDDIMVLLFRFRVFFGG
jgi:hypothetical protein